MKIFEMVNEQEKDEDYQPRSGGKQWRDAFTPFNFTDLHKMKLQNNWIKESGYLKKMSQYEDFTYILDLLNYFLLQ